MDRVRLFSPDAAAALTMKRHATGRASFTLGPPARGSLKEHVYIIFTSLAVVLALRSHADETTPRPRRRPSASW